MKVLITGGAGEEVLTEKSKLNPLSHYAVTKIWGEEALKGKNYIIYRLGTNIKLVIDPKWRI